MSESRPTALATTAVLVLLSGATCSAGIAAPVPEPPTSAGATSGATAADAAADPWQPFVFFLGRWQGEENGTFGKGSGDRSYRVILQGRYLLAENHSVFPRQEGLPEGDDHQDWALFSHDRGRGTYVLRQFTSEGYVNRYALDPSSVVPERMVFVSEASENAPAGLRTRLTYEIVGPDQFTEVFEIAPPGKELAVVLTNRWRRAGTAPEATPEIQPTDESGP